MTAWWTISGHPVTSRAELSRSKLLECSAKKRRNYTFNYIQIFFTIAFLYFCYRLYALQKYNVSYTVILLTKIYEDLHHVAKWLAFNTCCWIAKLLSE